jgi:hypothetical protein
MVINVHRTQAGSVVEREGDGELMVNLPHCGDDTKNARSQLSPLRGPALQKIDQ